MATRLRKNTRPIRPGTWGGPQPYAGPSPTGRPGPARNAMGRGGPTGTTNPSTPRGEAQRRARMFRNLANRPPRQQGQGRPSGATPYRNPASPADPPSIPPPAPPPDRGNGRGRRGNRNGRQGGMPNDVPRNSAGRPVGNRNGYRPGVNWMISGNNGRDTSLPGLRGDVYYERGAPLEGEVWYFGHGPEGNRANGTYGPFGRNGETQMPWMPEGRDFYEIPGGADPLSPSDLPEYVQDQLGGDPESAHTPPTPDTAPIPGPPTMPRRMPEQPTPRILADVLAYFDSPEEAERYMGQFYPNFKLPRR